MLFTSTHNLEEKIVELLIKDGPLQAAALHSRLQGVTLQAVYKHLRELVKQKVVTKDKKFYTLSSEWLINLLHVSLRALNTSLSAGLIVPLPEPLEITLPDPFYGFTLARRLSLDSILSSPGSPKTIYEWSFCSWYRLIQQQAESNYLKQLKDNNLRHIIVYGSRAYLDRRAEEFYRDSNVSVKYSGTEILTPPPQTLLLAGDRIVQVFLDDGLIKQLNRIYSCTNSAVDINPGQTADSFREHARCTVKITDDAKEALYLLKKFRALLA
ncbi:MAG: hypothetical protein D6719_08185 [Candidatus Dadabacteria bacterium]|nr:MAG: hypothetical protein D6719_08185 [Candidatus Dadabacteria bacterium]